LRHGRTLAAIPKSTIQTSPRFAAGIGSLLFVHIPEHGFSRLLEEERFVWLIQLAQPA
jgi:hypothetical protein